MAKKKKRNIFAKIGKAVGSAPKALKKVAAVGLGAAGKGLLGGLGGGAFGSLLGGVVNQAGVIGRKKKRGAFLEGLGLGGLGAAAETAIEGFTKKGGDDKSATGGGAGGADQGDGVGNKFDADPNAGGSIIQKYGLLAAVVLVVFFVFMRK